MPEIIYRQIKYDDLEAITTFFSNNLTEAYGALLFGLLIEQNPEYCFLATIESSEKCIMECDIMKCRKACGSKVVGAILAREENKCAGYIGMLATDPEYRSRGIGSNLLDIIIGKFKNNCVSAIYLETEVSNRASLGLYMKKGFVKIDYYDDYYLDRQAAYRMYLRL